LSTHWSCPRLLLLMTPFILALLMVFMSGAGSAAEIPGNGDFRLFKDPPAANDFTMVTSDGNQVRLSDLKGSVVILNFWRQECPYCVVEKRHLKALMQRLSTSDVKVVCVNFWDNPAAVRAYGRKNGGELLVAARPDTGASVVENRVKGRLMGYYVVNEAGEAIYEVKGFPSSYVIDKEGRVIAAHMGMAEWATPPVRNWIASLMGTETPADHVAPREHELPSWIDRLLSGATNGIPTSGPIAERRAQAAPTN
jgi:peroxiredoxin